MTMSFVSMVTLIGCTTDQSTPPREGSGPVRQEPSRAASDAVATRAAHTATTLKNGSVLLAGGCVADGCSRATNSVFVLRTHRDARAAAMEVPVTLTPRRC